MEGYIKQVAIENENIILRYFNIKKLVIIQINASGKWLEAEPFQDDGLVSF